MEKLAILGKRLICDDCGGKYYDMNRSPAQCPRCGCTKIRKKSLKTAITSPVNINVEEEEEISKDDIGLDPLDDIDLAADSDDDDLDELDSFDSHDDD